MKLKEMIAAMADCKNEIERRIAESSSYFFQQIENEEIEWMCEIYPAINNLSAKAFRFLWGKA